ncbi:MAG: hypothetical protein Q9221_003824 [Calogaya cf. arnoldii]
MPDVEPATEQSHLLPRLAHDRRFSAVRNEADTDSILSTRVSKEEQLLATTSVGERLPYNDYTTIDWLHDLVKDSFRSRIIHARPGIRGYLGSVFESGQGWIAAALTGLLTACVAFCVDVAEATVSDWKLGYCSTNIFANRENCCTNRHPLGTTKANLGEGCLAWHMWTNDYWKAFGIFVGFALAFGVISSSFTMLTKSTLPSAAPGHGDKSPPFTTGGDKGVVGKSMYLAAGSGIPEIKTILSGFVIPHFLDLKVLVIKAIGAVFAVATGMCLGKEGPFVHIATCVAYLVGMLFPKYNENGRKMRELLSAGCSAGLSVAFGAPIGGVLFSYEEISTYFPRKVLWKAFLCSLVAAMVLKALNPTGTGKLVLFETNYGISYSPVHYLVFVLLGIAGGLFGGVFCKANFWWSKTFRKYAIISRYPVFEVFLVVLATGLLQYPNPMTREPGDVIIKNLLVDCRGKSVAWVCQQEAKNDPKYIGWLVYGTLVKLVLTIITFGSKVPSGIIIPALDAGAFFGRLVGQWIPSISPGIFAMVGAAAFLAGVSRMTISLCAIMFELTGELEYIVPHMIAILVAKWVADALEKDGVYDLAQAVLGHPFLDADHAMNLVQGQQELVRRLIPPKKTMQDITVDVPKDNKISKRILTDKLEKLKERGLMDAGLVLVQDGMLQGYLAEGELDFGLNSLGMDWQSTSRIRLLGEAEEGDFDLSMFVDRTPLTICASAPMEYLVEMFGKLGLRYICVVEEGSSRVVGVIIKKRLVVWLESLKHRKRKGCRCRLV